MMLDPCDWLSICMLFELAGLSLLFQEDSWKFWIFSIWTIPLLDFLPNDAFYNYLGFLLLSSFLDYNFLASLPAWLFFSFLLTRYNFFLFHPLLPLFVCSCVPFSSVFVSEAVWFLICFRALSSNFRVFLGLVDPVLPCHLSFKTFLINQ